MSIEATAGEQAQSASRPLHVRSALELFVALESREGATRMAALQAVQKAPETAFSFGVREHRDVIDVLLSQAEQFRGELEWLYWIGALAAFRDSRVVRLFTFLITTESHAELLFALANYLRTEPVQRTRSRLVAALMQNECAARARAVAVVLSPHSCLSKAEALRRGLLSEGDGNSLLPMFSEYVDEWLSELEGPFQWEARIELERQGAPTLSALVRYWGRLSESTKQWLLEWAAEIDAELVSDAVREALTGNATAVILSALGAAAKLQDSAAYPGAFITPLLDHHDELVRRAAVISCRSAVDWRMYFENEPSTLVREACIAKVMGQEGGAAIPFALGQLNNPDWGIRAAAVEGLVALGKSGVEAAFTLLPEAGEAVRASIGRMVIQLEDEELIDRFILLSREQE